MAEFRRRRAKLRVKAEEIDYKNVDLLKRFVSDKGKINPSRVTGANAKLQRRIAKAITIQMSSSWGKAKNLV